MVIDRKIKELGEFNYELPFLMDETDEHKTTTEDTQNKQSGAVHGSGTNEGTPVYTT